MNCDKAVKKISSLSDCKEIFGKSDVLEKSWKKATKLIYDLIKEEEKCLSFCGSKDSMPNLHIKNMNSEQVWQQLELQNQILVDISKLEAPIDKFNLVTAIANLSNKFSDDIQNKGEDNEDLSDDEGVETGDDLDDSKELEETSDLESEGSDYSNADAELDADLEKEDKDGELSEFSDLDADTFGDVAVHDTDDEEQETEQDTGRKPKISGRRFKPSSIDSQFLNLRESEWIADNDVIGKDNSFDEDVDLMEDLESEDSGDEAKEAMYDAFFDPPPDYSGEVKEDSFEEDAQVEEMEEEKFDGEEKDNNLKEENETDEAISNNISEKSKASYFEKYLDKQKDIVESLHEEYYMTEKPWLLKGEVQKAHRPENSTLEEHLDYSVAVRQKPIITEETTKNIEKLLLSRIRNQSWDDVERKLKPNIDPFKFKKKLILDQEKSKKSLAAIYEEEFVKKQGEKGGKTASSSILTTPDTDQFEQLPIHVEIKKEMEQVFMKLDALANYHYTPKYQTPEVKVVSNLPSITIEESTPTIASDATLLAPQEVVAPLRGEMKGDTEKTGTDKKRERRLKKAHQKARSKREDDKLKHQLKKKGKDGLMNAEASIKMVEKAVKKGQVKVLESQEKSHKSSTAFFNQLQSDKINRKRKPENKDNVERKKRKKSKELTMAQLLL